MQKSLKRHRFRLAGAPPVGDDRGLLGLLAYCMLWAQMGAGRTEALALSAGEGFVQSTGCLLRES
jgi:hypothetical protein